MTPLEGRSLLRGGILLLTLSVIRMGVEGSWAPGQATSEEESDLSWLLEESREAGEELERRSAPLGRGETLDPNRSPPEELDRLTGIGPATAQAWVRSRVEGGGFAGPEDLLRVPGIGPVTLEKIRGHLDFTAGVPLEIRKVPRKRPAPGPAPGPALNTVRVDLNRAGFEELQSLPGIGPALAQRILDNRRQEGPFRTAKELLRVPGIGPATLNRLQGRILPRGSTS